MNQAPDHPVEVSVRRVETHDPQIPLPAYATDGAAGMDICACLAEEYRETGMQIAPGDRALVPTGIALGIPPGFEIQIRPRSGLALKRGLTLLNTPGTIDCDYRGEIGLIVINHGLDPIVVQHGMRVAQMVVAPVVRAVLKDVQDLDATRRGQGGFGSTGSAGVTRQTNGEIRNLSEGAKC